VGLSGGSVGRLVVTAFLMEAADSNQDHQANYPSKQNGNMHKE
jgi:hypothetical protein